MVDQSKSIVYRHIVSVAPVVNYVCHLQHVNELRNGSRVRRDSGICRHMDVPKRDVKSSGNIVGQRKLRFVPSGISALKRDVLPTLHRNEVVIVQQSIDVVRVGVLSAMWHLGNCNGMGCAL